MADERKVDPRYDPAFQRGFEGSVTSAPRSRPIQRSESVAPAPFRPPLAAVTDADETHDQDDVAPARETVPEPVADTAPRRLSRNPFLIALTLLGAIMTAGGVAWANQARMLVATRGGAATDLDYWFLQASVVGAPLTIVAGIGIIAGVLFIAAIAWNKRG